MHSAVAGNNLTFSGEEFMKGGEVGSLTKTVHIRLELAATILTKMQINEEQNRHMRRLRLKYMPISGSTHDSLHAPPLPLSEVLDSALGVCMVILKRPLRGKDRRGVLLYERLPWVDLVPAV